MATTVYFNNTLATPTRWNAGTGYTEFDGFSERGWSAKALTTARGSGVVSATTNTNSGPTDGAEVNGGASNSSYRFVSAPLSADVTISGTITFNLRASENSMSANAAINCAVWKIDGDTGGLTQIIKTARTTELGTSEAAANFTGTPTSTACVRGDRLVAVVFADDSTSTMAAGFTFTFWYSGTTGAASGDSFITFTETFSFDTTDPTTTTVYPTDTASPVSTADVDREAWTSRGAGVQNDVTDTFTGPAAKQQVTDTAGGTGVSWFTRPLEALTLSGPALVNLRGLESNAAADAALLCEIAVVNGDGSGAVVWGLNGTKELGTSEAGTQIYVSGADTAVSVGQRLRIRLYIDDAFDAGSVGMVSSYTVTSYYAGTSGGASGDTYLTFTQTLTEYVTANPPYRSRYPQLLAH